jgi:type IV pilus assembly protein PilX
MASAPSAQRGVALAIALILLVVITLVGFAAVRGTIMQNRMTSNQYDREVAFQSAESAMRAAQDMIGNNTMAIARNCQSGAVACPANPFTDTNLPASAIQSVVSGTSAGQFAAGSTAAMQPQFVIENFGNWPDPTSDTGFNQSASAHNYGAQGVSTTAVYYRVTARSGDPSKVGDRAVVYLQAMIKQG